MSTPIKIKSPGFRGRLSLVLTSRVWVWSTFVAFVALVLYGTVHMTSQIKLTGSATSPILLFGGLFGVSVFACASVLLTQQWHARFSLDNDLNGVQKLHRVAVPRIGGLPIFIAVAAGVVWMGLRDHPLFELNLLLLVCGFPVFMIGFAEDITKKISVKLRLQATFLGGFLACGALGAVVTSVSWAPLDKLLAFAPVAWCFTAFAMSGYSNAINLIDGLNGLASGVVCILALGLGLLGLQHQAMDMALYAILLTAAVLGFWVFNFPVGRLFLGDGGAYFLGFALAVLAVLLQANYNEINAWSVLSVLAYPVIEVLYSILRRKLVNADPGQPDCSHFHQYFQRSLQIVARKRGGAVGICVNSQASPFLWLFTLLSVALALYFDQLGLHALGFVCTALLYVISYQLLGRYIARNAVWENK